MLAAAAAWEAVAFELATAATGYGSVVNELTGVWLGPASLSMTAAAAPYVAWLHSTSVQLEGTAAQAKAAAAAYELAFAMTVPPPVIAANRSLLLTLVATNFFGQNSPAIAATEAHYAEMWIQDATAMYSYAGSSFTAGQLSPFTTPNPISDPTGLAAQSSSVANAGSTAASQPTALLPALLSALGIPAADPLTAPSTISTGLAVTKIVNTVFSGSNAGNTGRGILIADERLAYQATQDSPPGSDTIPASIANPTPTAFVRPGGPTLAGVSAGIGRATPVGSLSVPPSWTTDATEIRPVAMALPDPGTAAAPTAAVGFPPVSGNGVSPSLLGTLSLQQFEEPRTKIKPVIVRSPAAG
jgi:PPE-repeat protein